MYQAGEAGDERVAVVAGHDEQVAALCDAHQVQALAPILRARLRGLLEPGRAQRDALAAAARIHQLRHRRAVDHQHPRAFEAQVGIGEVRNGERQPDAFASCVTC